MSSRRLLPKYPLIVDIYSYYQSKKGKREAGEKNANV